MRSGVIDVKLAESLPDGARQLAGILKEGLISGSVQPFLTRLVDQSGRERNDGTTFLTMEEIMRMDWLCDNVEGHIPALSELLPMSRETTRLLSLENAAEEGGIR